MLHFRCKKNDIRGKERSDPSGRVARGHKIFSKSIFIGKAEGPGSLGRPPPPLCLPPHARPLPVQHPAPLHVISLARVESQQTHLDIRRQARPRGSCSRLFRPFHPGPRLRHLPPLLQGPHMRGLSFRMNSGLYFSPEMYSRTLKPPRGTRLGGKSKIEHMF